VGIFWILIIFIKKNKFKKSPTKKIKKNTRKTNSKKKNKNDFLGF
jgi:hypothetical protein